MHNHTHSVARYQSTKKVALISAVINMILAVIKIVFGILGLSSALVADGIHSLSDVVCDGVVMIAAYFAHHDADEDHPYGHRRFETAATFLLGLVLMIVALIIAYDAASGIVEHRLIKPDAYTVIIAIISILANECLFRYAMSMAKRLNSTLLKANAWHNRGDVLSSVVVLIGLLGALAGWFFLDNIAAVLVALFIGKIGVEWFWKAFGEFTEKGLAPETLAKIKTCIAEVDGVVSLHQLRSRTMADEVFLDVHLLINNQLTASEGHYISERVHYHVSKQFPEITDVTVHIDVENHAHVLPETLLPSRKTVLNALTPIWQTFMDTSQLHAIDLYYNGHESIDMRLLLTPPVDNELILKLKQSITQVSALKSIEIAVLAS